MKLALPTLPTLPQAAPPLLQPIDNSMDLQGLAQIFTSRLWLIALTSVLCLGGGIAYLLKTPKLYAANAVLEAKSPTQGLTFTNPSSLATESSALEEQHTFEQSLTTRTLLIDVARALKLDEDSRLLPQLKAGKPATDFDLAKAFEPRVKAELRRGTRLIDLTVTYFDPETAKLIADKVIELYVAQGVSTESGASLKARNALSAEAESLRHKLEESDKALQGFKETNTGALQSDGYNLSLERTKELNMQFSRAKGQRLQLEADISKLEEVPAESIASLMAIGSIAAQPPVLALNKTINEKEAEFLVLKEWSGPRHPRYIQAQKELDYLTSSRDDAVKDAAAKLRDSYQNALDAENKLQAAITEQERTTRELGKKTLPLAQLENEVKTNRDLYEMVARRAKEANLNATLAVANFRVTEAPIVQPDAVSPKKSQILALALVAGLMLGAGAAFGLEVLKPAAPSASPEAPSIPEIPILAEIPATQYDPLALAMDCARHRHSPECAAFRTLRSSLSFLRHNQESRSIGVSGVTDDGEASFCALNLAATYAGENLRTLLIVLDFQNHDLERLLIDPARGPVRGLFEGLVNSLQPESFCHVTQIPNLYFIPAGIPTTDPTELLASENFRELMMRAWASVDRIVLCTPPVMEMQDAMVPLHYTEAVCLVAKSDRTPRAQLSAAAGRLRLPGHAPAGLVLTGAPPRIMSGQAMPARALLTAGADYKA